MGHGFSSPVGKQNTRVLTTSYPHLSLGSTRDIRDIVQLGLCYSTADTGWVRRDGVNIPDPCDPV